MSPSAFASLRSLRILRLSRNKLKELDARALRPLAQLSTLGLEHNRIADLDADTFKGCKQVSTMRSVGLDLNHKINPLFKQSSRQMALSL